jgi:putative spermidine/putrescine transport system ATP-binding protein
MSKVILRNISKNYGETIALSGMNIEINEGELVSLLGPSGCGKTTALKIVSGLTKADSGQVYFDSTDVTELAPAKRDIGMVFQAYSLFPNMTARENVEFGLHTRGLSRSDIKLRTKEIFEVIDLSSQVDRYPHQLSGGQQQRIALARAIVVRPRILLLDEPLSALDAQVRVQLRDEIRKVQKEFGITTLFVTHDQEEAMTISDRVGVMNQGQLIQFGSPKSIYEKPANATIAKFIGVMNEVPALVVDTNLEVFGVKLQIAEGSTFDSNHVQVMALIRPEEIKLVSKENADFSGRILDISFLGPISNLKISGPNSIELKCSVSSHEINHFKVGDSIGLKIASPTVLAVTK